MISKKVLYIIAAVLFVLGMGYAVKSCVDGNKQTRMQEGLTYTIARDSLDTMMKNAVEQALRRQADSLGKHIGRVDTVILKARVIDRQTEQHYYTNPTPENGREALKDKNTTIAALEENDSLKSSLLAVKDRIIENRDSLIDIKDGHLREALKTGQEAVTRLGKKNAQRWVVSAGVSHGFDHRGQQTTILGGHVGFKVFAF